MKNINNLEKKITIDLSDLKKGQELKILDMHNDPEWALQQLEKANDNDYFLTVQSSLDEFMGKTNESQKERFKKVRYKLKNIVPKANQKINKNA